MKIIEIKYNSKGEQRVKFIVDDILHIVRDKLNVRFIKMNRKEYLFEYKNGNYQKTEFSLVYEKLKKYLEEEFHNLELSERISFENFTSQLIEKIILIYNRKFEIFLGKDFDPPESVLHVIKLETDFEYIYADKRKRMNKFIREEKFVTTKCLFNGFFNKQGRAYYRKIKKDTYLLLYFDAPNSIGLMPMYDIFKVKADNLKELYKRKDEDIEDVCLGFDPNINLKYYLKELD